MRGLALFEADFSIGSVLSQSVSDIDLPDMAIRPGFDGQGAPEVDAVGVGDAEDRIPFDDRIDRSVIAEDAAVGAGAGNVRDVIAPDHQGGVLGPYVDGPCIHQEIHRRILPVSVRLRDGIGDDRSRGGMFHFLREMHTHADGAASVIRETVPPDEVVRPRAADAGIGLPISAHPLENTVLHHCPGRVIVREHADTAAVFKTAFFHRNPV